MWLAGQVRSDYGGEGGSRMLTTGEQVNRAFPADLPRTGCAYGAHAQCYPRPDGDENGRLADDQCQEQR